MVDTILAKVLFICLTSIPGIQSPDRDGRGLYNIISRLLSEHPPCRPGRDWCCSVSPDTTPRGCAQAYSEKLRHKVISVSLDATMPWQAGTVLGYKRLCGIQQ